MLAEGSAGSAESRLRVAMLVLTLGAVCVLSWSMSGCTPPPQPPGSLARGTEGLTPPGRYLHLPPDIARRWDLPVGLDLPEVRWEAIPVAVVESLRAPRPDAARSCLRFFQAERGYVVWTQNAVTCGASAGAGAGSIGPDSVTLVDITTHGVWRAPFHGMEAWICPAIHAAPDGSVVEEPCPSWRSRVVTSNGSFTELEAEDVLRALRGPGGGPAPRELLIERFQRARFVQGRDYCYVTLDGESQARPFECGWLWVGLAAGLDTADPIPDLLHRIQAINGGRLGLGRLEGLRLRVDLGTERKAAMELLRDSRIRFVELAWAGLDLW